jgi:hypothetical protein
MPYEELTTAKAVIEKLGGEEALQKLTSRKYNAIFNWRVINKFPANTFTLFQDELRKLGCTAPASLWGMMNADSADDERVAS